MMRRLSLAIFLGLLMIVAFSNHHLQADAFVHIPSSVILAVAVPKSPSTSRLFLQNDNEENDDDDDDDKRKLDRLKAWVERQTSKNDLPPQVAAHYRRLLRNSFTNQQESQQQPRSLSPDEMSSITDWIKSQHKRKRQERLAAVQKLTVRNYNQEDDDFQEEEDDMMGDEDDSPNSYMLQLSLGPKHHWKRRLGNDDMTFLFDWIKDKGSRRRLERLLDDNNSNNNNNNNNNKDSTKRGGEEVDDDAWQ